MVYFKYFIPRVLYQNHGKLHIWKNSLQINLSKLHKRNDYPLIKSALNPHLVMYNSRSACKGSVSASGLTFWPHSHTLFKEEVMFSEIWMSGCGLKQTLLSLWINIMVVVYKTKSNIHYYLRLCENDHTNKMNSYVGAESNISQKLRGLRE